VLSNAFQQVVWVYRAITVLAEQIGNIPFLFSSGERGRENLITHGPLVDFYDRPHPHINRFEYWELRIIWLMLRGECFRIPIYANPPTHTLTPTPPRYLSAPGEQRQREVTSLGSRAPRSDAPLRTLLMPDPSHFHHIIENHQLIGWRYTGFGRNAPLESQVFLPEEVWFEKLPNPFNFWRGLAPLHVAALAAETDFAAGSFMKGVLENNADLGLIVKTKDQLGPEQWEQLKAALRDRKRRAGTADGPLLLWNTAEVIQPKLSSGDLQFLENRKFSRAEICAAFGVPEEIVTTTDHSKYDVMDGARLNFIEHRVAPLCRRLEASEDATVKSLDPNAVGWFDLDSLPIMQKAQRDRLATARSVFDMGVPFNELNRVLDLGFRRLPWGDRGYVAARLNEVGEERLTSKVQSPRSEEQGALERMCGLLEESLKSGNCSQLGISPESTVQSTESEEGVAVPIRFAPGSESRTDQSAFKSRLRRFLFEQRRRVLSALAGEASSLSAEDIVNLENLSPSAKLENQKVEAAFDPIALLFEGERARIDEFTVSAQLGAEHATALRERLKREAKTLRESLFQSLAEGQRQGETRGQLAERVRAIYNRALSSPRL